MVFLFDVLRTDIQMNNRANQTIMRNILIILIVISELTFFSSCKKKEGPPLYGYIRISVIDTLTGLPIKDAIINSSPSGIDNEKTNTNGVLFSGKLDKDNYDISISIHGYISQIKKSVKILVEDKDTVKELGKEMKQKFACGGTVKDNEIELQGKHKNRVIEFLIKKGYKEELIDARG